jgi:hypothetical protein
VLLKVQPLVFGVAALARGGPPAFSVGILVGAEIGTAGIAALFWLVSVTLGARRRVCADLDRVGTMSCQGRSEHRRGRLALFDVHNDAQHVDTVTSAARSCDEPGRRSPWKNHPQTLRTRRRASDRARPKATMSPRTTPP